MAANKKAAGKAAVKKIAPLSRQKIRKGDYVVFKGGDVVFEVESIETTKVSGRDVRKAHILEVTDGSNAGAHYERVSNLRRVRKPRADKGTKVAKVEPAPFTFDVGQKVRLCMPSWPTIDGKAVEVIGRRNKAGSENIYACTVPEGAGDLVIVHDGFLQVFESMLEPAPTMLDRFKDAELATAVVTACEDAIDEQRRNGIILPPCARNGSTVWIVGRTYDQTWDFQGVFLTDAEAEAACADADWFMAPAVVGELLPHDTSAWPGIHWPKLTFAAYAREVPVPDGFISNPPMDGVARDETSWRALTYILGGAMIITTLIQLANHFHWFG